MTVAAPHYAMIIDWSDEDQAYLVTVPDLPGCRTHGESYADAARKGQDAIEGWVELHLADGRPLPAPAHTGIGEQFDPLARPLAETQAMASSESAGPSALSEVRAVGGSPPLRRQHRLVPRSETIVTLLVCIRLYLERVGALRQRNGSAKGDRRGSGI